MADDVVTMDGRDFLCEGLIGYDEDGHRWSGGRLVDGGDIKWLVIGIERAGGGTFRLMVVDESHPITGYPPEAIVIGEVRYVLDKRSTATCHMHGDVGSIGGVKPKDRPPGHVERCRWSSPRSPSSTSRCSGRWRGRRPPSWR